MQHGFAGTLRGSLRASLCDPFGDLRTTPPFCDLVQAALPQPCLLGPRTGSLVGGAGRIRLRPGLELAEAVAGSSIQIEGD